MDSSSRPSDSSHESLMSLSGLGFPHLTVEAVMSAWDGAPHCTLYMVGAWELWAFFSFLSLL